MHFQSKYLTIQTKYSLMDNHIQVGRDLYLLLAPGYETHKVARSNDGLIGFRDFINRQTDQALRSPLVPDK